MVARTLRSSSTFAVAACVALFLGCGDDDSAPSDGGTDPDLGPIRDSGADAFEPTTDAFTPADAFAGGDAGTMDAGPDDAGTCAENAHLEGDICECDEGFVEMDGACVVACDPACGPGLSCQDGACRIDLVGSVPPGPVPDCAAGVGDVPDWECTVNCDDLLQFAPDDGPGWLDGHLFGETSDDQYRSYLRRDVMMLVKYATAMTACQAASWTVGNGGDLVLGDMSEADGSIPGTRESAAAHPVGTHTDGSDIDLAYFQNGTADNTIRPICETSVGGVNEYHCVEEPTLLDVWRTALVIGHLHVNSELRAIGVDGEAGPLIETALATLCTDGWLSGDVCTTPKVQYATTDDGRGWYRFHFQLMHVAVN